ncbi:hypothetical protein [Pleurocapsa sp. CCALA 161]|uniref:hypothetical protein n=1 Tax=Pleurocapsa sp. CCALA 161 TaxID=2107688 RepID=UPI0011B23640|nr:hypothetical protein [Pleurocapsa sp. CCALA 161]
MRVVLITGEQFEVGLKGEFLDRRLAATLSAYQITRANDVVPGFKFSLTIAFLEQITEGD